MEKLEKIFENEPKPDKKVLFIRHPSVKWLNRLVEQADEEGKDIETYAPIDQEGLGMTQSLSGWLKENLSDILDDAGDESGKYNIYSSPIKRAKSEAQIISKNLKLAHTEDTDIPLPENNEPITQEFLSEMPIPYTKDEALEIVEEAKEKGVSAMELILLKDPQKTADSMNEAIKQVEDSLEFLKKDSSDVSLVFSHRISIALHLWVIEQKQKGRSNFEITAEDVPSIVDKAEKLPYTSISEVDLKGENFETKKVGDTPHLS